MYINEIWKNIKGYNEDYQISNLGRVKSLKYGKEKILKQGYSGNPKYPAVTLSINRIQKKEKVHQLVAIAFLNHKKQGHKLVVNHIDFDVNNNRLDNLEVVTNRENCNLKHKKSTSKYTGVYLINEWRATIQINGKQKHLGSFKNEYDAHLAYQKELNLIKTNKTNHEREI
jgi:hypothetical protein